MRTRLTVLALLAALGACTSKSEPADRRGAPPPETAAPAAPDEEKPAPVQIVDGEGKLIPSNEYIAGIRLPRGVELFRADELTHVYRLRAPIDKVLAYFGPMMITGNVERRGKGAVYRRASVRGAEISPTKVDLSILALEGNLVRISVTELPPPPPHQPTSEQTKAAARDAFRMLD